MRLKHIPQRQFILLVQVMVSVRTKYGSYLADQLTRVVWSDKFNSSYKVVPEALEIDCSSPCQHYWSVACKTWSTIIQLQA